ncbi:MAG: GDP-mannose 4,6-dehydratase [Bacillota bacterium]|nr:GDP-mannose 4,6-dehydratase [Bacillota bacterium]
MKANFWQDRPVMVTGSSGFLGGWLVRRLVEAGADLVCPVRDWVPASQLISAGLTEKVNLVRGDITDQGLLERALGEYEVKTVFHLAAQTIVPIANRNPVSTFESNIRGTWSLLEACRRSPNVEQIVTASSDKAYGEHESLPYSEEFSLQGAFPYDVSKSCSDLISQSYHATYSVPVTITRCGNFFGGGDLNWNRIVPGTIRSVLRGQRPVIRSDGQYIRDYFYIEDGAAAYMLLAEKMAEKSSLAGEAFNFSNEIQLTVLELVNKILAVMKSDLEPDVRSEADHEIKHQYLSAEKARRMLGWSPLFSIDEALKRTVDWYRGFLTGDR